MKWKLKDGAENIEAITKRGIILNGVLFNQDVNHADTIVIAITGIHGNFYSNPFYFNFAATLNAHNIPFVYAQVCDAFGEIQTQNVLTNQNIIIGSWNERFEDADDDVNSYIDWAQRAGYHHIILAGHSLGANKVIHYLSNHHDNRIDKFILLSPANLRHLTAQVNIYEKQVIKRIIHNGNGQTKLPFELLGWIPCNADTASDWVFTDTLNNVHVEKDTDFSQVANITHTGAMLIGSLDRFTYGDPRGFLKNINDHCQAPENNELIFIENTGHTYQQKEQETANAILHFVQTCMRQF
jgi:pimeloyl-ACP methyl ester carboxylesterase